MMEEARYGGGARCFRRADFRGSDLLSRKRKPVLEVTMSTAGILLPEGVYRQQSIRAPDGQIWPSETALGEQGFVLLAPPGGILRTGMLGDAAVALDEEAAAEEKKRSSGPQPGGQLQILLCAI